MQEKRYFADSSLVQFHIVEKTQSKWEPKGPGKRGHIVAHDVSWAAQTGKHLLRTQNVSEQNQKHFVSRTQHLCPRGQTGKHLCRQQCVRKNVSSFAWALRRGSHVRKQGAEKNGFFYSPWYKFQWNLSRCVESNAKSNKRFISRMAVLRLLWTTWYAFQLSSAKQNTIWHGLWNCLKKIPVQTLS